MSLADILSGIGDIQTGYLRGQRAQDQHQSALYQQALRQLAVQQGQQKQSALAALAGGLANLPQGGNMPMAPPIPQQQPAPMSLGQAPSGQRYQSGLPVRGSWFGNFAGQNNWQDPSDSGLQASGQPVSAGPGIALPTRSTLGNAYDVTTPDGRTFRLPQTDVGPAKWTGRGVDINAPAAEAMGYTPKNFPTDQPFKVALSQEINLRGATMAKAGIPPPAVQGATQAASSALQNIDPSQYGRSSLRAAWDAVNKGSPNADPIAKALAVGMLQKMMAPEDQLAYRMYMQQNQDQLRIALKDMQIAAMGAGLTERERHDRAMEGIAAGQAGNKPDTPFQPTDAEGKPIGPPMVLRGGAATPIRGLPEGTGLTRVGTKPASGNVSDLQAEWVASYIQTTGSWPVGSGRNQALQNKVEQILAAKGVDPTKIAQAAGAFQADKSSLAAAQKLADAAGSYEQTALKNLENATKQIHAAAPTNWGPAVNKWIETGETFVGDPTVPASTAAVITLANEYAKVMSGATGAAAPTEGARAEAAQILNPYFSSGQWDAVTERVIKPDMKNRMAALHDQVDIIKSRIGRGGQSTGAPQAQGAAVPSAGAGQNLDVTEEQYNKLPSGSVYTIPGDPTPRIKQ